MAKLTTGGCLYGFNELKSNPDTAVIAVHIALSSLMPFVDDVRRDLFRLLAAAAARPSSDRTKTAISQILSASKQPALQLEPILAIVQPSVARDSRKRKRSSFDDLSGVTWRDGAEPFSCILASLDG